MGISWYLKQFVFNGFWRKSFVRTEILLIGWFTGTLIVQVTVEYYSVLIYVRSENCVWRFWPWPDEMICFRQCWRTKDQKALHFSGVLRKNLFEKEHVVIENPEDSQNQRIRCKFCFFPSKQIIAIYSVSKSIHLCHVGDVSSYNFYPIICNLRDLQTIVIPSRFKLFLGWSDARI